MSGDGSASIDGADDRRPDRDGHDEWPEFELRYTIEASADTPDRCTVYPADSAEWKLLTQWITAKEGAFVSVDRVR